MVWVILNQPKAKAEELLAEEQAGFRPGQSTEEEGSSLVLVTGKNWNSCQLSQTRLLGSPDIDFMKPV